MRLSICTPCRNDGKYIALAYQSLKGLLHAGDAEWVIVDDASTEETQLVLANIASEIPEGIRVLRNDKSCGAPFSRNRAFRESAGEWIAFLDADDGYAGQWTGLPEKLAQTPSDTIPYLPTFLIADGEIIVQPHQDFQCTKGDALRYFIETPYIALSACFLPRKIVEGVGGWDESLQANQDGDLLWRLCLSGVRFQFCACGMGFVYRHHEDGRRISHSTDIEKPRSRLDSLRKLCRTLEERGLMERYKQSVRRRILTDLLYYGRRYPEIASEALQLRYDLGRFSTQQPSERSTLLRRRRVFDAQMHALLLSWKIRHPFRR